MLNKVRDLGAMALAYCVQAKNTIYEEWPKLKFYVTNNLTKTFLMLTAAQLIIMLPFSTPLVFLASFLASSTGFMFGYSTIGNDKVPGIILGTSSSIIASIMVGILSSLPGIGPIFGISSSIVSGGLLYTYAKEDYNANVALKTATQDTQKDAWVKAQGTMGFLFRLVETPTRWAINHFAPDTVIPTFEPLPDTLVSPRRALPSTSLIPLSIARSATTPGTTIGHQR